MIRDTSRDLWCTPTNRIRFFSQNGFPIIESVQKIESYQHHSTRPIKTDNMKRITNYRELLPNNYYYINEPGFIIKENEQGPQPRYNSKECILFIAYTHENNHVAKFEKKLDNHTYVQVIRNLQLYDIYECEIQTIYANIMTRLFEKYVDKETSYGMSIEQFVSRPPTNPLMQYNL